MTYEDCTDLQKAAVKAYRNGTVSSLFAECGAPLDACGDGLFRFIVEEVGDAGSTKEAVRMLETAMADLQEVISILKPASRRSFRR